MRLGEIEGEQPGSASLPYLVMEYVEGESLESRLRRTGPLATTEALRILRQMIEGLRVAWEKRIVHRDVKPGNVFLDRNGDGPDRRLRHRQAAPRQGGHGTHPGGACSGNAKVHLT